MWRKARVGAAAGAITLVAIACAPGSAAADPDPSFVPDEVVVRLVGEELPSEVRLPEGVPVPAAVRALRLNPAVAYAVPNYYAQAAGYVPNDPGKASVWAGWRELQWHFGNGPGGVRAEDAWANLRRAGQAGGAGVKVAVVDTGVAYRDLGDTFRKSPDFSSTQFTKAMYDFVHNDPRPLDKASHGTPVAGVIAERTNNERQLTGLAYGVKLMPIRALENVARAGGETNNIAKGIRYAADHGADVINLSLQFDPGTQASQIPELIEALDYAHGLGAVIVAAAGNHANSEVAYPARAEHVIAVGGVSVDGCLTYYTNWGQGLDLVAPSGGSNAEPEVDVNCAGKENAGTPIYQVTYTGPGFTNFSQVGRFGTSLSSPHVAATAALVIASGILGPNPSPEAVEQRIEATARPIGDGLHYGAGLLDAAAATAP